MVAAILAIIAAVNMGLAIYVVYTRPESHYSIR